VLIFKGKCSYFRVKPAHLAGHLPACYCHAATRQLPKQHAGISDAADSFYDIGLDGKIAA
jgi:hypothetical protein